VPGMVGHVALRKTGFWGAPIYRLARPRLGVLVGSGALALGPAHAGGDLRSRRRPSRPALAGRPRRVRCAGARPGSRWRRSSIPAASPSPGLGWASSSGPVRWRSARLTLAAILDPGGVSLARPRLGAFLRPARAGRFWRSLAFHRIALSPGSGWASPGLSGLVALRKNMRSDTPATRLSLSISPH
jgi:hypothetical protein